VIAPAMRLLRPAQVNASSPHTAFSVHAAAYKIAKAAFAQHETLCRPVGDDDPLQRAYESAYGPLVDALCQSAHKVIQTPAATTNELWQKLVIFDAEDMQDLVRAKELIGILIADALRIGGAA